MRTIVDLYYVIATTALTALIDGQYQEYQGILINGQAGTQSYDPSGSPIAQGGLNLQLPSCANALGGAAVIIGQLAYFGSNDKVPTFAVVNTHMAHNTTVLSAMTPGRTNYAMTALSNNTVLVCGGISASTYLTTCTQYNTLCDCWTDMPNWSLANAIANFPMLTLNGAPFVFGGAQGQMGIRQNKVFMLSQSVWTLQPPGMPEPLHSHSAVAVTVTSNTGTQSALVCGGVNDYGSNSATSTCYLYSPAKTGTQWTQVAAMNTARFGHGMAVYKGFVYVYGGMDVTGAMLASVEMWSSDGKSWQTQSTALTYKDQYFASVSLTIESPTTTSTTTTTTTTTTPKSARPAAIMSASLFTFSFILTALL